jgi:hypothetical protein
MVIDALNPQRLGFSPGQRRHEQGGKDGDDRNDHQQLNQRETALTA